MKKDMYELSVYTENNKIFIDGRDPRQDNDEYSRVSFPPEQVDILIQWLQEAKNELLK
ncbi:MAG: hypothetical protein V9G63_04790 [Candidatus Competibacter sp.]|nr:hypothetical protein [Candidatus Competibacter sp.]